MSLHYVKSSWVQLAIRVHVRVVPDTEGAGA